MVKVDNINEIYKNYMTMKDEEVKPYINSIAEEYDILYETVMKKLDKFVSSLSLLEQDAYKIRKEQLKKYSYKVSKKADFLTELNIKCLKSTGVPSKSILFLLNILNKNEKEGLEFLRKTQISEENYNKYLDEFKMKYPTQVEYINYLKNIYKKYNRKVSSSNVDKQLLYGYELDVLRKILDSDYSIEEYCSITGESIFKLREVLRYKRYRQDFVNLFKVLEERIASKKRFYSMVEQLINLIAYDNLDIVKYYEITKLSINEFYEEAKKLTSNKIALIKLIEFKNNNIKYAEIKINKDTELNGVNIINGRLVERQEKELVFNYLEENNIPLGFYKIYLKKYLNGELDIISKVKVKL